MPMSKMQALDAIEDRMVRRWMPHLRREIAPPIVAIGVKQMPGPDFGRFVVLTLEDMPVADLVAALRLVADQLEAHEV